jgi:uncharacterized damage-inducible protein DinB
MTVAELLSEFDLEMANTRKILECVPEDQFEWTPHAKSASLSKLANHLAAMPGLATAVINGQAKKMPETVLKAELLTEFDRLLATSREAIAATSDDHLAAAIPALQMTRMALLRARGMSHMIHHRGELSVYLRLLNVPVPGRYGPSADNKP